MNNCFDYNRLEKVIKYHALANPAAIAIVSSKYNSLTYAQLVLQIEHVAGELKKSGLGTSARIAIAVEDAALAALTIIAVASCAVAVPLDQNLAAAEIETRIKLLNVNAVCVLAGKQNATRTVAERHSITIIEMIMRDQCELTFSMFVQKISSQNQVKNTALDDMAIIFQTSGTTEEPKLVPCLHTGLLAAAKQTAMWFKLDRRDRCLSIAPPCYSHGLTFTILAPLLSGGSVAFPLSLTNLNLSEWFEILSPTWYSTSPTIHLAIAEKLVASSGLKHQLRLAGSGGAPLPETVRTNLEQALRIPVLEHYGMTEASQISSNLPPPGPAKPGTVGIPPFDTVIVVGRDGHHLLPGQRGEIWVRGPNVIREYLNGPDLNQAAFSDGWLHTGDIGSLDDEGFLTLHGRIKELINRGGEKISPFEVEAVILKHPAVAEAVVFAVSHPRLGEDVAVAVLLRPNETLAHDEFRRFMSKHISWNKIPRRLIIMDSIPKGMGGKALRRKLREVYA